MITTTAPQATIYDTWDANGIRFENTDTYRLVSTLASGVSDQMDALAASIGFDGMSDDQIATEKALRSEWAALAGFRTLGIYSLLAQVVA